MTRFRQMLCGIACAASLPLHAQPNLDKRFDKLDKDRNGEVSWREAYPMRVMEFSKLDKNFDGILEQNEFHDRALPFQQFDANADGRLELSEYIAKHHAMFKQADANGDSTVSRQEFSRTQQYVRSQPPDMKSAPR